MSDPFGPGQGPGGNSLDVLYPPLEDFAPVIDTPDGVDVFDGSYQFFVGADGTIYAIPSAFNAGEQLRRYGLSAISTSSVEYLVENGSLLSTPSKEVVDGLSELERQQAEALAEYERLEAVRQLELDQAALDVERQNARLARANDADRQNLEFLRRSMALQQTGDDITAARTELARRGAELRNFNGQGAYRAAVRDEDADLVRMARALQLEQSEFGVNNSINERNITASQNAADLLAAQQNQSILNPPTPPPDLVGQALDDYILENIR